VQSRDGEGPGEVMGGGFLHGLVGGIRCSFLALNMAPDPDYVSMQYLPKGLNQKSHTNVGSDSAEEHVRLQLGAWD
jgi:hypothetical protein